MGLVRDRGSVSIGSHWEICKILKAPMSLPAGTASPRLCRAEVCVGRRFDKIGISIIGSLAVCERPPLFHGGAARRREKQMKYTEQDIQTAARTVWGEARGEPFLGKVAVAHVLLNRQRAGRWFSGDSLSSTCLKSKQFSCWNTNDPNLSKMEKVTLDDSSFQDCMLATLLAALGREPDPTLGATHYHACYIDIPKWARSGEKTRVIGRHIFYKGVD